MVGRGIARSSETFFSKNRKKGLGMLETKKEDTHRQKDLKMLEDERKLGEQVSVGGKRSMGG